MKTPEPEASADHDLAERIMTVRASAARAARSGENVEEIVSELSRLVAIKLARHRNRLEMAVEAGHTKSGDLLAMNDGKENTGAGPASGSGDAGNEPRPSAPSGDGQPRTEPLPTEARPDPGLTPGDVQRPGTRGAVGEDLIERGGTQIDGQSSDPRTRRLQEGNQTHRNAPERPNEISEWEVPIGGRVDRYSPSQSHLREIKPDIPADLPLPEQEKRWREYVDIVQRYRSRFEGRTGVPHTAELSLYRYNANGEIEWRHFAVTRDRRLVPVPDIRPGSHTNNDARTRVFGHDLRDAVRERAWSGLNDVDRVIEREWLEELARRRRRIRRRAGNRTRPRRGR